MRQLGITMDEQIAVLAVADKGSFEAAGKYLGVGRSAVRKRVQSVENELGASIFYPSRSRGMVPTEAGNLYLLQVRESVRHAWLGVDRVRAFVQAQSSELRIAYSTYLNTRLLDVIRRLAVRSTNVTRESLSTRQVVSGVLRGNLHAGFGILPILENDISARLLFEEPLMVCFPVGHRLSAKSTIQPEDLENEPVVSVARKEVPGRHQEIGNHFESHGVALSYVTDAYSPEEALWLVTQGIGISLMTRFSASVCRYNVVVRPLSDRLLTVKSGIFTRRDHNEKLVLDFADLAWIETAALRVNPS
jgi:LysR family transcriptional regulator, benzoate and cis,cis-muconate-responsive activator of ben and cat genes